MRTKALSCSEILDVEVLNIQGVLFDEFASQFDVVAHEDCEGFFGFDHIAEGHLYEGTLGFVHRGFPQLFGVHFTEAFVSLDALSAGAFGHDGFDETGHAGDLLLAGTEFDAYFALAGEVDPTFVDFGEFSEVSELD